MTDAYTSPTNTPEDGYVFSFTLTAHEAHAALVQAQASLLKTYRASKFALNLRTMLETASSLFIAIGIGVCMYTQRQLLGVMPYEWWILFLLGCLLANFSVISAVKKIYKLQISRLICSGGTVRLNSIGVQWESDASLTRMPWHLIQQAHLSAGVYGFVTRDFICYYLPLRCVPSELREALATDIARWQGAAVGLLPHSEHTIDVELPWTVVQKARLACWLMLGVFLCLSPLWYAHVLDAYLAIFTDQYR